MRIASRASGSAVHHVYSCSVNGLPRPCGNDARHTMHQSCTHQFLAVFAIGTSGDVLKGWSCWLFTFRPPST